MTCLPSWDVISSPDSVDGGPGQSKRSFGFSVNNEGYNVDNDLGSHPENILLLMGSNLKLQDS